jgi:hypothetical protein
VLASALLSAAALVVMPSAARAQSAQALTLDVRSISRNPPYRQSREWWINYEECVANDVFRFPLQIRDTGDPVEVWAGTSDCAANRGNTTERGQCWIVAREASPDFSFTIDIPVRNIVARRITGTMPPMNLSASVCDESTDPGGEQFTFYILQEEGGRAGASVTWDGGPEGTGFDLVGPEPPGAISVGIGESQLAIRIDDVDEEADRERFEAFCVPEGTMPLPVGEVDAGVIADAGADATSSGTATSGVDAGGLAPAACFSSIIRSGRRPPIGFSCGVAGETSTTLRTDRLTNNTTYAVGIAGQDAVGNAGVLSQLECGTPIELDDFYEIYSRNGGLGGGGFCTLPRAPQRPSHGSLIAFGGLVALLGLRRARTSR